MHLDFDLKEIKMKFMTYGDIIADVGGYKSSLSPIVSFFVPFMTIKYLATLGSIIKNRKVF